MGGTAREAGSDGQWVFRERVAAPDEEELTSSLM